MNSALRFVAALSIACIALCLYQGCGSKAPKGVPEVPACRQAATAITESMFDTGIDLLRRQADAYSECMTAHGYVLDQQLLDEQLEYVRQVENAKWLGGDPFYIIAKRRQQLRMSPALWRAAPPPTSRKVDDAWAGKPYAGPSPIVKSRVSPRRVGGCDGLVTTSSEPDVRSRHAAEPSQRPL